MELTPEQAQLDIPSMLASYRAYLEENSFVARANARLSLHNNPQTLPNTTARPQSPDANPFRQQQRPTIEASPNRTVLAETSLISPRRGSPPRLNDFIARMEQSLSSGSSRVGEGLTPPSSPPSPADPRILSSPNASGLVDHANGFATSASKRRKVERVPRPETTLYDDLARRRQAQPVRCAYGACSCGANTQVENPSPSLREQDLTRANLLPWYAARGIELRPEEAGVLNDFLARRYEAPPSPPSTPPMRVVRSPSPSPRITIAEVLAQRENPLLEPLRSRLFMLEEAGVGDMEFDGELAMVVMEVWPIWT